MKLVRIAGSPVGAVVAVAALCGAWACSSSDSSPSVQSTNGSQVPAAGASGGGTGTTSGSSTGSSTSSGNSGSGGPSASGGSSASTGAPVSGTSSGSTAGLDMGAVGVTCGASFCAPPLSCCQTGSATPVCVPGCDTNARQLCGSIDDCQGNGDCVNGYCTGEADAGITDAYVPPLDAPVYMPGQDSDGGIPTGYPMPTTANRAMCQTVTPSATTCRGGQGPACVECLFGGSDYNTSVTPPGTATAIAEAGNYLVTVQLGGAAAGLTTITAESSRGMLAPVMTAAGQSAEYAFVVNVRDMEGQPDHAGGFGGYPGLDLFFSGPTATPPQVTAIGYALAMPATKPIMVYIASDSTACDQTGNVFGGWGQMLPEYLGPPVGIANYADSGKSSTDFPYWANIKAKWTPGDWVIIQFGHNDGGNSDAVVQAHLESFVSDALAANVTPLLVSPPARANYVGNVLGSQGSLHAAAAKAAAAAKKVAFIDLTSLSTAWYNSLGSWAVAQKYHPSASEHTHTNLEGARILAGLVAGDMKSQNIPLAKYLR